MILSGTELRNLRQAKGLSQAKLSDLSGVPQHLVSAYELGKNSLTERDMSALQKTLSEITDSQIQRIRKKRYQNHSFQGYAKGPSKSHKSIRTDGNAEYLNLLRRLEERREVKEYKGRAISLFSGCGGFSLGFSWAGFELLGFSELNRAFADIYRTNFPTTVELGTDIQQVQEDTISSWGEKFGAIDVIIGGPPCQGFSLSGKRDSTDPRNTLFKHYLRVVSGLRPKVAVMENVRLLTSMKGADGKLVLEHIKNDFGVSGYAVEHFEINAKDYGVPQHRERVIFVAIRKDLNIKPSLPAPTHGEKLTLYSTTLPYRTFADACSDLEFLESGEKSSSDPLHEAVRHPDHVIKWLWDVPEGKSAHENEDVLMRPPSGYNTTYKRQIWNEPASTVQTTFGMISGCRNVHPIATRSLTIREAARIQSFPDTYRFVGSLGDIRTTIGNAVPPLLAYEIARHMQDNVLNLVEVARL